MFSFSQLIVHLLNFPLIFDIIFKFCLFTPIPQIIFFMLEVLYALLSTSIDQIFFSLSQSFPLILLLDVIYTQLHKQNLLLSLYFFLALFFLIQLLSFLIQLFSFLIQLHTFLPQLYPTNLYNFKLHVQLIVFIVVLSLAM